MIKQIADRAHINTNSNNQTPTTGNITVVTDNELWRVCLSFFLIGVGSLTPQENTNPKIEKNAITINENKIKSGTNNKDLFCLRNKKVALKIGLMKLIFFLKKKKKRR